MPKSGADAVDLVHRRYSDIYGPMVFRSQRALNEIGTG